MAHEVVDAAVHAQRRAGKPLLAGKRDAVTCVEFDLDFAQAVAAGRASGGHDGVGDQDAAFEPFGAQRDIQKRFAAGGCRRR